MFVLVFYFHTPNVIKVEPFFITYKLIFWWKEYLWGYWDDVWNIRERELLFQKKIMRKSFDESLKINISWLLSEEGVLLSWEVTIGGKLRKIRVYIFELWLLWKDLIFMTHLFDNLWSYLWALASIYYSLINLNDLDYLRIHITVKKTYDGTYDNLILSIFSKILGRSK